MMKLLEVNIRYLEIWSKEERVKTLSTIFKRMVEGKEYQKIERDVREMAIASNCSIGDISLSWEYPNEAKW